ncbi:MAG TPA: hypothetical protein DHU96_15655 [Actinobacteria bacterium]|nr:hypothetical protein [Actinomycetota bacterium]
MSVAIRMPTAVASQRLRPLEGYFGGDSETAATIDADGWLHTGDIGVIDETGRLRITDRIKDMYIVGGFNAYPAEIESILCGHPAVAHAAVIGVPDSRMAEVGAAFIVPRVGKPAEAARLIAWSRQDMASYKAPRRVHIIGEPPVNAAGKVLKTVLRGRLAGQAADR